MNALLENVLVIVVVGLAAAYLVGLVFKRRKKSCQCSACPTPKDSPAATGPRKPGAS